MIYQNDNDNHTIEYIHKILSETFLSPKRPKSTNIIKLIKNCGLGLLNIKDDDKSNVQNVFIYQIIKFSLIQLMFSKE